MDNLTNADLIKSLPAEDKEAETKAVENTEVKADDSQESLKKELEKVKSQKEGHTKLEKLLFTKKRIEQQLAEFNEESGIEPIVDEDENKPVTVKMLKELEAQKAQKTAKQMADEITDDTEKELVIHHLENSIRPSGNPTEDLRLARAIVNSHKNAQIAEELSRKSPIKQSGGAGASAKTEDIFEPTDEEATFMRPPFNIKKEDIIKARRLTEDKRR